MALALALRRQGADVRVATHERFRGLAESYGVPFAALPGDPAAMMATEAGRRAIASGKNVARFLAAFRQLTAELAVDSWDAALAALADREVLVFSTFAFQGHYLAQHLGIRGIAAHLQPLLPTAAFASPALPRPLPGRLLRRWSHHAAIAMFWRQARPGAVALAQHVPEMVVPRRAPFAEHLATHLALVAVSPRVVPRPPDWPPAVHLTGYWRLPLPPGFAPPADVAAFLADGPPPIYIGFGSLSQPDPAGLRELVEAALAQLGRRGIVQRGWSGIGGPSSSPQIHVLEDDIPHAWLFPRVAAVVHHGGAGTTAAALSAGVPSVVVPHFGDQWFWAERVRQLGAGVQIARRGLTASALSRASAQALAQRFPTALAEQLVADDGAAEAARLVLGG